MKAKTRLLTLAVAGALLLFSCKSNTPGNSAYGGQGGGRNDGKFYAQNLVNNTFYSLYADLLYENEFCKVWAERSKGITIAQAKDAADAYKDLIYPKMLNTFGAPFDLIIDPGPPPITKPVNTIELADYLGDEDGKLCILLLEIKDGWSTANPSLIAGYFTAYNFFAHNPMFPETWYSNECDMIYIDTKVFPPGTVESNRVLAHELQHMMNFVTTIATRSTANSYQQMDLWIDEGLSSAAEYVVLGHSQSRIDWYTTNWDTNGGRIANGNNFFVWGNHTNIYPMAIHDDYSTVYLFFQWLRLQSKNPLLEQANPNIYSRISNSAKSNYLAVTDAATLDIDSVYANNWSLLLRDWMAANHINASSGRYGYRGDPALILINAWPLSGSSPSYQLAPGEGVYTSKTTMPTATELIKYAGLPPRGSASNPNDSNTVTGGVLLSYNVNTNIRGVSSPGNPFSLETVFTETQTAANAARGLNGQPVYSGPYVIGIGDILGYDRQEEKIPGLDFSRLNGRITANE